VVAAGAPHHVTQRGNARRVVFETDSDRLVYLDLLRHYSRLYRLGLHGYCLMSNHVHLIAIPEQPDSLPLALKTAHGRYAAYLNARQSTSGHVWQGRYYSCPLDRYHLWEALRYTERNPVRAGLVGQPEQYRWSSAAAHFGLGDISGMLLLDMWQTRWTPAVWRDYVHAGSADALAERIRSSTHTGRLLGSQEFVAEWEAVLGRPLARRKGGRPAKQTREE
jgi:putative transposase